MTALKDKIKNALDESRMMILVAQVLLGFEYRAVFEPLFEKLPNGSKFAALAGLTILLPVIAMLMSPGPYHRIIWHGNDAEDVHDFTTRVMDIALFPFALAFGTAIYVATGSLLGAGSAIALGLVVTVIALFFWYGWGLLYKTREATKNKRDKGAAMKKESEQTPLKDRIAQVLTEARVVLPGAQALLGFQFITMLGEGFQSLPASSKYVHLGSLLLMALSIVFLMAPAAFHRIVERGENTERVDAFASNMLLAAMVPLPLGISGDFFVVVRKVSGSATIAIAASAVILVFFYGLWFGYTNYRRRKLARA